MSKYAVQFMIKPEQIVAMLQDPEMKGFLDLATYNGIAAQFDGDNGWTPYRVLRAASSALVATGVDLQALIKRAVEEFHVYTKIDTGIWMEVPTTAVDNLVDVDWPFSKVPATEESPETRRVLENYTVAVVGENGTSLLRCGYKKQDSGGLDGLTVDTPEVIALYTEKWPTGTLVYDKRAWEVANVSIP